MTKSEGSLAGLYRHNYAEDVSRPKEEIVTGDGGQQSTSASLGTPPSTTTKKGGTRYRQAHAARTHDQAAQQTDSL